MDVEWEVEISDNDFAERSVKYGIHVIALFIIIIGLKNNIFRWFYSMNYQNKIWAKGLILWSTTRNIKTKSFKDIIVLFTILWSWISSFYFVIGFRWIRMWLSFVFSSNDLNVFQFLFYNVVENQHNISDWCNLSVDSFYI